MNRIVIAGGGQAAAVAARTLRHRGFDGDVEIVGSEPHRPYQRPPLSKEFLASGDNEGDDGLFLLSETWCERNDVRIRLGQAVERIDAATGAVELADGARIPVDAVLIATGGRPVRLPDAGNGERIHYLRTLDDARRLRGQLRPGAHVIVVGAGFVGAEVAAAARAAGAAVTLVEAGHAPLERLLGSRIGAACARIHRENGADLCLGHPVDSVRQTGEAVMVTTREAVVEGDLAVIGVGMRPNSEIAARSGIAVGDGVVVDEYCRTSVPNVYAAGDVANHYHPLFGERVRVEHFDNASRQAAAAAANMLGAARVYDDPHWFWSDQYDVNLQYAGHARADDEVVVRGSLTELNFCAFYLRGGIVRAAFGVNRANDVTLARELIAGRRAVEPTRLADDGVDLAELAGVEEYA